MSNWTAEQPKEEGYYWFKETPYSEARIVCVSILPVVGVCYQTWHTEKGVNTTYNPNGKWYGPLTKPENRGEHLASKHRAGEIEKAVKHLKMVGTEVDHENANAECVRDCWLLAQEYIKLSQAITQAVSVNAVVCE